MYLCSNHIYVYIYILYMLLNLQRRRLQHLVGRGAPSRSSCCTLATLAGKLAENYINPACFRFQDERNRKHSYLKPEYVMRQVWCLSVTPTSSCQYLWPIQHYCTRCQGLWQCMGASGEDIDHHSLADKNKTGLYWMEVLLWVHSSKMRLYSFPQTCPKAN